MLGRKGKETGPERLLDEFMQAFDSLSMDETAICSATLDIVLKQTGERPCCIWMRAAGMEKVSERDMVGMPDELPKNIGASAFSAIQGDGDFAGLLHVPIGIAQQAVGVLSVGVTSKEKDDKIFMRRIQHLGCLLGLYLQNAKSQKKTEDQERRLKAEVQAANRELESTNQKLIERVRELKTLYKELQKRVEELTKANKAKDEFLSIVSHELRTPLTSLTGFLAVLLDEEAGAINDQQRKFLGIAKASAVRLNIIISDLLDISRIESGRLNLEMGQCSLPDILKASVEGLRSSAVSKGLELSLHPANAIPSVWGDPSRLQQVVDNLVANAIKFTDKGGRVDIEIENKGDVVQVSVKDTGTGMTAEEQAKVFDMFYQADSSARRSAAGAGLGLAIARGIITMHGGQIVVMSEKGVGSTFSFMVPRQKVQKAA